MQRATAKAPDTVEVIGRYALSSPIAKGGMAVVHLARALGPEGFSRIVAAKRLLPQYVEDADFVAMFLDEAKIASKVHHPNVVPVIDIVFSESEVILVQEYVHGVPLDQLCKIAWAGGDGIPPAIAISIVAGMLSGLHAAHEATDEVGEALHVVHRDVSPHNVMVTVDGVARVLDFGIAKARSSSHVTREGVFKGKLSYLAPEQLIGGNVTRRADIYGTGVVLWELLAGRRLFAGEKMEATRLMAAVIEGSFPRMKEALAADWLRLPPERRGAIERLDPIVMRALSTDASLRFATAEEMLTSMVAVLQPASPMEVASWLKVRGREFLETKQRAIVESEEVSRRLRVDYVNGPDSASRVMISRTTPASPMSAAPMAVSVAPHAAPPSESRRRALAFAGIGGAFATLLLVLLVRPGGDPAPANAGQPATTSAEMQVTPTVIIETPPRGRVPAEPTNANGSESTHAQPPPHAAPAPPPRPAPAPPPKARAPERPARSTPEPRADAKSPEPEKAPSAGSPPAPAASADCTPPYFFEGTKKIYKPNCL